MTLFWLAMDHSRKELFSSIGSGDIRPDLVSAAREVRWGLIVGPNDIPRGGDAEVAPLCLGLPDLFDRRAIESLSVPMTPLMSVKVGFAHIDDWGCEETVRAVLDRTSHFTHHYLEPYCLNPECLRAVFNLTKEAPASISLKLAIDQSSMQALSAAGNLDGWLARSDGIPWDSFFLQLDAARIAGCVGVMVGRALWGDAVARPSAERRALIRHRMALIQSVLDEATPSSSLT